MDLRKKTDSRHSLHINMERINWKCEFYA